MGSRRAFLLSGARAGLALPLAVLLGCEAESPPAPATTATSPPGAGQSATLAASPVASAARARWQRLEPAGAKPPARHDHSVTADVEGTRAYVFGGRAASNGLNDLWAYDVAANAWQQVQPDGAAPATRWGHNAAFDAQRNALVVFGGQTAGGFFSDVWAYEVAANRWERLNADNAGPSRRYGAGGSYEPSARTITVTHGFTDSGRFDDTWAFAVGDARWSELSPRAGERPLRRCLLRTIVDPEAGRVLLFGGQSNTAPFMNDLWAFDMSARSWQQLAASSAPPPRNLYAAVRRGDRREALVHGGNTPSGNSAELWLLDLARDSWALVAPEGEAPAARRGHDLAWLRDAQAALLFGGVADRDVDDLWQLSFA
jgi:hypothetical protein